MFTQPGCRVCGQVAAVVPFDLQFSLVINNDVSGGYVVRDITELQIAMPTIAIPTFDAGTVVAQPDVVEEAVVPVFPGDAKLAMLLLDVLDRQS